MAGFLRPRRGRRSTAESQAIILKRGEVFFECPDTGVGTGTGKIKVGDGTTAYADLPYFMDLSSVTTDVAGSAIAFTESTTTDNATLLASIKSGATLKTMISAMKKLLSNLDTSVTQLNNDLDNKANSNHTHSNYSLTSHTHSNYVTSTQVTSLVNTAIESGEIKVGSGGFTGCLKKTESFTYNGKGVFLDLGASSYFGSQSYSLIIDGNRIFGKSVHNSDTPPYDIVVPFSRSCQVTMTDEVTWSGLIWYY